MINCKKCGAELPDYAKFCNLCGSAVGEVKSGAEINTVENNKEELSPKPEVKDEEPQNTGINIRTLSKKHMLIIAIIFILIVVVGIAIGIKKSDNRDNLQSTQKQTETSAENTDSEEDAEDAEDADASNIKTVLVEKGNYKIIEAGQTNESGTLYCGFIVKNGENSNVIKNFKFRITVRNKKGEIIGSSEDEAYLKADAGQDIPLSSSVDIEGKPDKIEYEIMDVEKIDEEFKSLKDINVMKPIGLKIRGLKEDNYSRMLTGELDNESATSYDSVKVYLIFRDKNGRIVGGCVEDSESVKKKSKSPISISLYRKFVTKDFEVYAIGDK